MKARPAVTVWVGNETRRGIARIVTDASEDRLARRLLAAKYQGWHDGAEMSNWATTALPVAIDL